VKAGTARRLARRLDRAGAPDRRARRRLLEAGDAGDAAATDAVWEAWLASPDDELWRALARWRRPAGQRTRELSLVALGEGQVSEEPLREALADAAGRAGHPVAELARERILARPRDQRVVDAVCAAAAGSRGTPELVAWCAGHGLVPADPVRRAVFFLLTGQDGQYRAADPDGSLIALGYAATPDPDRARLRAAMADAGDLDLARVVARRASGDRLRLMTDTEATYLTGQLAGRRDWPGLWRLARDLPLAGAVAAVRSFGDGWRPTDDRGRALFARLARADPTTVGADRLRLMSPEVRWIMGAGTLGCSLSPDGCQLALGYRMPGVAGRLSVYDLPSGTWTERYDLRIRPDLVLHLGEAILAAALRTYGTSILMRYAGGQGTELFRYQGRLQLQPCASGFVALLRPDGGSGPARLRFCTAAGRVIRDVPLAELGIPDDGSLLTADPPSGQLALTAGGQKLWIVDGDPARATRLIGYAESPRPGIGGACFAGPGLLAVTTVGGLHLWRLDGGRLDIEADGISRNNEVVAAPERGTIAVDDSADGTVQLLDLELAEVTKIRGLYRRAVGFTTLHGRPLLGSPYGRYLVLHHDRGVSFADTAYIALAHRPLAAMTAADLALAAQPRRGSMNFVLRPDFLGLLRDVLELRFADEVALGDAPGPARADDIGLARPAVDDDETGFRPGSGGRP